MTIEFVLSLLKKIAVALHTFRISREGEWDGDQTTKSTQWINKWPEMSANVNSASNLENCQWPFTKLPTQHTESVLEWSIEMFYMAVLCCYHSHFCVMDFDTEKRMSERVCAAVRKKIEDNKIRKLFNEDFMAFPKKLTNSASEKVKPLSDNIPLRKHMRVCGRNPQICLVSVVNVFSLPKLVSHVIIITMIIIVYPLREREAPSPYKTNARINRRISDAALRP